MDYVYDLLLDCVDDIVDPGSQAWREDCRGRVSVSHHDHDDGLAFVLQHNHYYNNFVLVVGDNG